MLSEMTWLLNHRDDQSSLLIYTRGDKGSALYKWVRARLWPVLSKSAFYCTLQGRQREALPALA